MSIGLWWIAMALVAAAGAPLCRFDPVASMNRGEKIVIAFAGGSLWLALVMFIASSAGIEWRSWWIALLLLTPLMAAQIGSHRARPRPAAPDRATLLAIAAFFALSLYGVITARETCADLVYIWGAKAARFAVQRSIDVPFLGDPAHRLMHPDYPPLVPLLYAWGAVVSGSVSAWGALLLTPLAIAGSALVVRAFARASGRPTETATLMAAILSFGFAQALAAGGADPILIVFEVTALSALTFAGETTGGLTVASVALTGVVLTKVEGAAFGVAIVVAYALAGGRWRRAVSIALLPFVALASWIAFASHHGLTESYAFASSPIRWPLLPSVIVAVVREASYHALWLPWIAAGAILILLRRGIRAAAAPLIAAGTSMLLTMFFYLHAADPLPWVASSAGRVLLTPLAMLAVAAAAAVPIATIPASE